MIVNPNSGPLHRRRLIPKLIKQLQADLPLLEVVFSQKSGDAFEFAKRAIGSNARLILCSGGDGTINEVANAIYGTDVILGILPTGTGNGLARETGFSMKPLKAAKQLISGRAVPVYPAFLNEKLFLLVSGAGLNAYVAQQTDQNFPRLKKFTGFLSYLIVTQLTGLKYAYPKITATLDGENHFCYGLVVMKSKCKIGWLHIAEPVSLETNRLGVFLFKEKGLFNLFRFTLAFLFQTHLRNARFPFFLCNEVSAISNTSVPVQYDGEMTDPLPARWKLSEKRIFIIYPKENQ